MRERIYQGETVLQCMERITALETQLMRAKSDLRNIPGSDFTLAAIKYSWNFTGATVEDLAEEIKERDFPLSYQEIREIMERSGLPGERTDSLIDSCHPDDPDYCREFNEELRRSE